MNKLFFTAAIPIFLLLVPNVIATDTDEPMRCEGHIYEDISDFPELEEGKCYGTCEKRSVGLVCDIEEIQK
jgi:hypothetical protein